jgi:hypothetical protein
MFFLSVKLPPTSLRRLKNPPSVAKNICSFCGKDETPLFQIPNEIIKWTFQFPVYGCTECMENENKMSLLKEIIIIHSLENLYVSIHFDGHFFVNPSGVYIPFFGSSGNLRFLCVNKKCSLKVSSSHVSDDDCLFNESSVRGCVIDPQSGEIKTSSVPISQIILGVDLLNRILRGEFLCSYIRPICEFDSQFPDVSPRIPKFSIEDPNSILKLFSLIVSGIYSDGAINAVLNGEMKEVFLKFITDSMISMTAFMRQNGFDDCLPELKEESVIPDFLTKNNGRTDLAFTNLNIISQNFRNLLKLFRKILRYLSYVDDSQCSIDLFQYCRFLYATVHVSNREIYHRFTRQVSHFRKFSPYFEYLEKRYVMSASPFCVKIFAMVPASETELDTCSFCLTEHSANVIGKCKKHNICCLDCFREVVKKQSTCSTCRNPDFLP